MTMSLCHHVPKLLCRYVAMSLVTMSLFTMPLESAFEQRYPSARVAALSGAFVALANDSSAIYYNPAGLRFVPGNELSTTYTNFYGLTELTDMVGSFVFPTAEYGSVGLSYNQFGDSVYKETEILFSHGFYLSKDFAFGYGIRGLSVKIKEYGSGSATGLDCGFAGNIKDKISLGFSASNLNSPNIGKVSEPVGKNFQMGVSFQPVEGIHSNFDMSKSDDFEDIILHLGEEMNLSKFFAMRFGVKTQPTSFSIGFGLKKGALRLDYAYLSHPVLDPSHIFSLSLRFGVEEKIVRKYEKKKKRETRKREVGRSTSRSPQLVEGETGYPPIGKVNINTASVEELESLPGVGKVMAKRIIDYRTETGPFKLVEDILNVPRMSRRVYSKIEGLITVEKRPEVGSRPPASRRAGKSEVKEPEPEPEAEKPAPVVPKVEEEKETPVPIPPPADPKVKPKPEPEPLPVSTGKININNADISQLKDLGFTTVQAQNILRFIKKNGPLSSVDDLKKVPGIPLDIVDEVKDNITVK